MSRILPRCSKCRGVDPTQPRKEWDPPYCTCRRTAPPKREPLVPNPCAGMPFEVPRDLAEMMGLSDTNHNMLLRAKDMVARQDAVMVKGIMRKGGEELLAALLKLPPGAVVDLRTIPPTWREENLRSLLGD